MNEQNNNVNQNQVPINNNPIAGGGPLPTNEPSINPQVNPAAPVSPIEASTPIQPAAPTIVNTVTEQPTPTVAPPINQVNIQPTPTPQPIPNQGMAPVTPTPVTSVPNNMEQPVTPVNPIPTNNNNIEPQVVNQINQSGMEQPVVSNIAGPTPSEPINPINQGAPMTNQDIQPQDITPSAPISPIASPTSPSLEPAPSVPVNGVFAPSIPIGGATDATNVGFVAAGSDIPKKKNKGVTAIIIIIILAILGAVGYFIIYPYIMKTYFSDPKNVYETTIKAAFKELNAAANDLVHNKGIYSIEASFNTNIASLEDYAGYTYGVNFGIDPTKKTLQEGLYIKNNSTNAEHSYYSYLKDNKIYDKYSSYRDYIYLGEITNEQANSLFEKFNIDELFETSNNLSSEDTNYVINKVADLLVESIDETKLSQEDASITVNGEILKVTNNKYEIDYDTAKMMLEHVRDGLIKDDKAIEIMAKMSNTSTEDIISNLKQVTMPEKNEENNKVITTSVYTYGNKNEIIGFAINDSEDKIKLYYYNKNNLIEAKATLNYLNEFSNKTETLVYKVTSSKEKDYTRVTIYTDDKDINETNKGQELLSLDIRSWNEQGIDLDYLINYNDESITGTLKFIIDVNSNRAKYAFSLTIKNNSEYIDLSLNLSNDWTSEVANINTNAAAGNLTNEEISSYREEFNRALLETPIGKALTTVSGDYDSSITDYYNQNNLDDSDFDEDFTTDPTNEI